MFNPAKFPVIGDLSEAIETGLQTLVIYSSPADRFNTGAEINVFLLLLSY